MADRDFEPRPLKEVLSEFSQQKGVRKGIQKVRVEQLWKDTLGAYIYRYTRSIRLEGTTLVVEITNATLKEEMRYAQESLLERLNEGVEGIQFKRMVLR